MRKFFIFLSVLMLTLSVAACGAWATATEAPVITPTENPSVSPTSLPAAPTEISTTGDFSYETTRDETPKNSKLGQMQLSYPSAMQPGSSKTVELSVYIPAELASVNAEDFARDVIPSGGANLLGKYASHNATIRLEQSMRAELIAPAFQIQELYPARQAVDLNAINAPTRWGWVISAPQTQSDHVLVVRIYLKNEQTPIWVGSFDVVVAAAPTVTLPPQTEPTSTPIPTPTPVSQRLLDSLLDPGVVAAILTSIVAVIGLYLQYKNKEKK